MDVYALDTRLRQLTPHQWKIVQALYDAGGRWLTRAQVARALDKKRLTPYDINCLKTLADMEIANVSTQPTTAPGSDFAYIYTMPDDIADLIQEWYEVRDSLRVHKDARKRRPLRLVQDEY